MAVTFSFRKVCPHPPKRVTSSPASVARSDPANRRFRTVAAGPIAQARSSRFPCTGTRPHAVRLQRPEWWKIAFCRATGRRHRHPDIRPFLQDGQVMPPNKPRVNPRTAADPALSIQLRQYITPHRLHTQTLRFEPQFLQVPLAINHNITRRWFFVEPKAIPPCVFRGCPRAPLRYPADRAWIDGQDRRR